MKEKVSKKFNELYGEGAILFASPGRINLIGEHTDYNDGFVLPCAIDYQTVISCAPRDDRTVRVIAADYDNQTDEFSLDAPIISHDTQQWSNYVRGVVKHLQQRNSHFGGADLVISGNVPQGAGLSSSASLEVAVGTVFQQLYHLPLDAIIGMYQAINPNVNGLLNCLLVFNLPFTFFKGMLDAVICFAIYKPLSPILHGRNSGGKSVTA